PENCVERVFAVHREHGHHAPAWLAPGYYGSLGPMPLLGAHMSIAGGYYKAVEHAHTSGCDVVQLFTKNNSQWRAKAIGEEDVKLFGAALVERKIAHPISHASYLINLASPDELLRQKSVEAMIVELERADLLGIPHV